MIIHFILLNLRLSYSICNLGGGVCWSMMISNVCILLLISL